MLRREFLKGIPPSLLILLIGIETTSCVQGDDADRQIMNHPVYPPQNTNRKQLEELCAPFLAMSMEELLALVPPQGGFLYAGCPNCQGGTGDDNITWNLSLGDKVQCRYCKMVFPNAQYPENEQVKMEMPAGGIQVFNIHANKNGKQYWFEAKRWYAQRDMLDKATYNLAQLYRIAPTQYQEAGRRAAAIMERFATLYPHYIVKYEYPSTPKVLLTDQDRKNGYKTKLGTGAEYAAKWSAWGYMDISISMLWAYDQLAGSDVPTGQQRKRIEGDLFDGMIRFVDGHGNLPINNMSPTLWRAQAIASNVLGRPEVAKDILPGIHQMLLTGFTSDGFWREGTVSYHRQTAGGFQNILAVLYPGQKNSASNKSLQQEYPEIYRTLYVTDDLRLPNGHYAALNDTWATEKYRGTPIEKSQPHLMPGLGYGILGRGQGKQQSQVHLKYSGRFGHHHYDSLNLLLFACEKELVSDLGYTHNKARPWASSTAAHNTVVVDGLNQIPGEAPRKAMGDLLLFNAKDEDFQAIESTALQAYSGLTDYRRALISVQAGSEVQYTVDIFNAAGGTSHDWILHGSAMEPQQLEWTTFDNKPLPEDSLPSLLPASYNFIPAEAEKDHAMIFEGPWAYGHFQNVKQHKTNQNIKATFRYLEDPQRGLQSWVLGGNESAYFKADSWSVRGIADQAKLDERLRTSFIVRRAGGTNCFTAVHVPFVNKPAVQQVTAYPWRADGTALKIEHSSGTDYVLYQNRPGLHQTNIDGHAVQFEGRVGLIRMQNDQVKLKMIGGSKLQFDGHVLTASAPSAPLMEVDKNTFTVKGSFNVAPGEVVIIRHGDGHTSAFHVDTTQKNGANTVIHIKEPAPFLKEDDGSLKMLFFPHLNLKGPHQVFSSVLSSQA